MLKLAVLTACEGPRSTLLFSLHSWPELSLLGEHCPAATLGAQGCQGRPSENVAFCSSRISCPGF